ncbi:MAG: FAD-binding protein [Solidesulfovibrio sp. DCME]|uniref:FAD-binding protein n=1 Tax=Solidesulfovibrio sp. DCME TaxID=3447380 RepID=UPI003D0AF745
MTHPLALPEVSPPVDVLVLGAGLGGMRAALAALAARPGAAVAVAMPGLGPCGSSFCNVNGRLGIHAPDGAAAAEAFCREVAALACPGFYDPALVAALAAEALPRRRELEAMGAAFEREPDGALRLYGSCFSPDSRRAAVVTDLPGLGRAFHDRVTAAGGLYLPRNTAVGLLRDPDGGGAVCGALLEDASGRLFAQPAGAVVAAMGGTAPLFTRHQGASGSVGFGHGLLAAVGAAMANTTFLQWMWAHLSDRRFWPVWELLGPTSRIDAALPEAVARLAAGRAGHCPLGHGFADAALDRWLLDAAGPDGVVAVHRAGEAFPVALFAHATNGGARIDERGRTDVPGLWAVGECATGMHGANRLGGSMVAACLVFGARAGETAAREAIRPGKAAWGRALGAGLSGFARDAAEAREVTGWLARTLQNNALPRQDGDAAGLEKALRRRRARTQDVVARAMLDAALLLGAPRGKDFPACVR